jgi:hypothetical protein
MQAELDASIYPPPNVIAGKLGKNSVVLKNHSQKQEHDYCLDFLNKMQAIPCKIVGISTIDVLHQPITDGITAANWAIIIAKNKAINKYKIDLKKSIQAVGNGELPVYFNYEMDFRGRNYPQGYHLNPQGNDTEKSLLVFWNQEICKPENIKYILRDIGNHAGHDKLAYSAKESIALEIINGTYQGALENPAQCKRAVQSYHDAINGVPSGTPISLDATASGAQILACLSGDMLGAVVSNLVYCDAPLDMYVVVHTTMREIDASLAELSRKIVKKALMAGLYGSTYQPKVLFGEEKLPVYQEAIDLHMPDVMALGQWLVRLHNQSALCHHWTLPDNFTAGCDSQAIIYEPHQSQGVNYFLETKINGGEKSDGMAANVIHSLDGWIVRELTHRCNYDSIKIAEIKVYLSTGHIPNSWGNCPDKFQLLKKLEVNRSRTGITSGRYIDTLDTGNISLVPAEVLTDLVNSLPSIPFEVMTIHDCFTVLPNYATDILEQYNNLLALLAGSDLLVSIVQDITKTTITPPTRPSQEFINNIRQANYSVC